MDGAQQASCGDESLLGVLVIPTVTTRGPIEVVQRLDPVTDRDGFRYALKSLAAEMTEVAVDGFTHFGHRTGDDVGVDHHPTKLSVAPAARSTASIASRAPSTS